MAQLNIERDRCVGCGACVRACPFSALSMRDKKAVVDRDRCTLCGACVQSCRFDAIALDAGQRGTANVADYRGIWVFAQQGEGEILPVAYELLGKGRELADASGEPLTALLFGDGVEDGAASLIAAGADRALVCQSPLLRDNLDETYADVIARLVEEHKPSILLFGATAFGRSLAPRVAARVRTGLTADCTVLEMENGLLHQTRPAFGGNLLATILCEGHRPQMATVRPGVMKARASDHTRKGEIVYIDPPKDGGRVRLLEQHREGKTGSIADAEIIVAAGRGIGSQKNLSLVRELAEALGGAVGVTRPLVDMGWSEYPHQIGQTGLSVAPKLLICCGISGAIQHLAGIGGAETVIAINTDAEAPIFTVAHYRVVGDCVEVLREMVRLQKENSAALQ